ncbi:MAG: hypothetical protein ACRDDW_02895 [Candidatus Rhabdochlamydia sp.]
MTDNNFLRIPQSIFGPSGVETGNLIYQTLEKQGFQTEYNFATCITVLDSSDLPRSVLGIILKGLSSEPPRLIIKEKRDAKGNLQIDLPQQDEPLLELRCDVLKLFLKMLMNVHF